MNTYIGDRKLSNDEEIVHTVLSRHKLKGFPNNSLSDIEDYTECSYPMKEIKRLMMECVEQTRKEMDDE